MRKDRSAFWIDYSGPGDRAMYSDNPMADVKSGRADTFKPTKIGRGWAEGTDYGGAAADEGGGDDGAPGEGESGAGTDTGGGTSAASGAKDRGATPAPVAPPAPGSDNGNVNSPALGSVARK
jgi:hypothetical protein